MADDTAKLTIALGANVASIAGSLEETLTRALAELPKRGLVVTSRSELFQTPYFPAGAGPDLLNGVVICETVLSPQDALEQLHQIEADFGRVRKERWGQRSLDLDLLSYADLVLPDAQTYAQWRNLPLAEQKEIAPDALILPHPRIQDRAFVLVPLAQVDPDWLHPVSGLSAQEMLSALPKADIQGVKPLK